MMTKLSQNRLTSPVLPRWPAGRLALLLLAGVAGPALAQERPDAGTLLQQIEKNLVPATPGASRLPRARPTPEELRDSGGAAITVKAFRYNGNTLLDRSTLDAVTRPWLGHNADLNELRKVARAVAEAYRERGWVVRAYLPKQDITEGTVTIQIVEARFSGARLDGKAASRIPVQRLQAIIARQQQQGQPLNAGALDRGLLLADDLPGVSVAGNLVAGEQDGETALLLKLSDEPLSSGELILDNSGSRSTGSARVAASVNLNSPLGLGELLTTNLIHSSGSDYVRLSASLPLGLDGLRVGISGSGLRYRLVGSDYQALAAHGTSATAGLDASYPLIRGRLLNLGLLANLDHKHFDNHASGTTTSRYAIDSVGAGIYANLTDELAGGGASLAHLTLRRGRVDLSGSPVARLDGSDGPFQQLRYNLARQQAISNTLSAYAALAGQWSKRNLDSAERFYLGGAGGVRAYPSSEAGGGAGQLLTLELRQRLAGDFTLIGFCDHGRIRQYHDNAGFNGAQLSGASPNRYRLSGCGLSLNWLSPLGATFRIGWARRLGVNPNPTASGRDQDGSYSPNRIWLYASLPFELGRSAVTAVSEVKP